MSVAMHPHFPQRRLGDAFGSAVGETFRGSVLPGITGGQAIRIFLVGWGLVFLLGGLGKAFGTYKHKS